MRFRGEFFPQTRQVLTSGFTLIEVLVALFVVALGVAGAAGLQTRALRAGREARQLSTGVQLASSLAERMRANPVAMALPDAANPYLQIDYDASTGPAPAAASCYADADCGPTQLAGFDIAEVEQAVAGVLPGGRIRVCRDATAPDPATGLPPWTCDGRDGAPLVIKLGWRGDRASVVPRLVLFAGAGPATFTPAGAP